MTGPQTPHHRSDGDRPSGDPEPSSSTDISGESGVSGGSTIGTGRAAEWASTMAGHVSVIADDGGAAAVRHAHRDGHTTVAPHPVADRVHREAIENEQLVPGATRSAGSGDRLVPEEPDRLRTCFERDRDRILHGTTAFRRLAGKTQVFIFPEDHQRTRLTHALEVAQVATAVARATGLNVALTEAIALGHDCGHGPGGHASEDAFTPYVDGGYDHAVWGADVVLAPLNLCAQTLDGIRNHSWSRPAPATPEGEVVSWADRIAYVCHDFEDAVHAGIVTPDMLPDMVRERCGSLRSQQLRAFIGSMIGTIASTGHISMDNDMADALAEFRRFNYHQIYMRPASRAQGDLVVRVLRALVEYFADRPNTLVFDDHPAGADGSLPVSFGRRHGSNHSAGSPEAVRAAVEYVAGMTDRFAFAAAVNHLGWDRSELPQGVGLR